MTRVSWQTVRVAPHYDVLAPDGSEIRLLVQTEAGSMVHCTLQPGNVTTAVRHRTVDEVWFCISGTGDLWRRSDAGDETTRLEAGVAASIPVGTEFQFRATGATALEVVITTMPPWPGEDEAVRTEGPWQPTLG